MGLMELFLAAQQAQAQRRPARTGGSSNDPLSPNYVDPNLKKEKPKSFMESILDTTPPSPLRAEPIITNIIPPNVSNLSGKLKEKIKDSVIMPVSPENVKKATASLTGNSLQNKAQKTAENAPVGSQAQETFNKKPLADQEAQIQEMIQKQVKNFQNKKLTEASIRSPIENEEALAAAQKQLKTIPGYGGIDESIKAAKTGIADFDRNLASARTSPFSTDFSSLIDFWNRQTGSGVTYKPPPQQNIKEMMLARAKALGEVGDLEKEKMKQVLEMFKMQFNPPDYHTTGTENIDIKKILEEIMAKQAPAPKGSGAGDKDFKVTPTKNFQAAKLQEESKAGMEEYRDLIKTHGLTPSGSIAKKMDAAYRRAFINAKDAANMGAVLSPNEQALVAGEIPPAHGLIATGMEGAAGLFNKMTGKDWAGRGGQEGFLNAWNSMISASEDSIKRNKETLKEDAPTAKGKQKVENVFGKLAIQKPEAQKLDPKIQEYADKYLKGNYQAAEKILKERGYGK